MNYKIGDTVRAIKQWASGGFWCIIKDNTYQIIDVEKDGSIVVYDNIGERVLFEPHEIEKFFGKSDNDSYESSMRIV